METAVNTYQGMNRDMSKDTIPSTFYIDALDIRITSAEDGSIGSITNIKGNSLSFSIPQVGATGVATIIGTANIRNTIVLFVADDSDSNGWIYTIGYSDKNSTIVSPLTEIYFDANLGFSKNNPIEAVGRYESDEVQRVIWTDYNKDLRSINIVEPTLAGIPVGKIDIHPDVEYIQPIIKSIDGGGSLYVGNYQFAYRLTTIDGKQTLISPPSNMTHITSGNHSLDPSSHYTGDPKGTQTSKSITITIDVTNYHDFDKIELISLFHEDYKGTPFIKTVETQTIPSGNTVTFNYTGNENETTVISSSEFYTKVYPFTTCKTLTQVDNSLLIANIKTNSFDIQNLLSPGESFDAKTYRYRNVSGTPQVNNDPFNQAYNKDAHWDALWHVNEAYKFKSDGLRLGGQGPNISYTFHLEPHYIDGITNAGVPSLAANPFNTHDLNDGYGTRPNNGYDSTASPMISGLLRGYKRGETYRFGIVFYNKKGESSFVEYIGDIKFPDISDKDSVNNASGTMYFPTATTSGGATIGYAMGIKFNIDFSSCPSLLNEITSYQIVRVPRTISDSRRITSGTLKVFSKSYITHNSNDSYDFRINNSTDVLHLLAVKPYSYDTGNGRIEYLRTQLTDGSSYPDILGDYTAIITPEVSYKFNNVSENILNNGNAMVLMTGVMSYNAYSYSQEVSDESIPSGSKLGEKVTDNRVTFRKVVPINKTGTNATYPTEGRYRGIEYVKLLEHKQLMQSSSTSGINSMITPQWGSYYMRNFYANVIAVGANLNRPHNDPSCLLGKGSTAILNKMYKVLVDPYTSNSLGIYSATNYFDGAGNASDNVASLSDQGKVIVDVLIPLKEIYGGYTNSALANNTFVPASPVIDKSVLSPIVFGGDIFVTTFTKNTAVTHNDSSFFDNAAIGDQKYIVNLTQTEVFITESLINIELDHGSTLRRGVTFAIDDSHIHTRYRQEDNNYYTDYGKSHTMYVYNGAYSEEGTDLTFFVKPLNNHSVNNVRNDLRSMLSDVKINNESIDSWTKFATNNYWDVDDYGPINKILKWKQNTYFFQDTAIGAYAINVRTIFNGGDGVPVQLGSGSGFQRHNYLSTENGSIHQWGIQDTDTAIYYFDAINRKLMRIKEGNEPLSEVKGIRTILSNFNGDVLLRKENGGDNPILDKGICIGRDGLNDEVLFTFKNIYSNPSGTSMTLVYDEFADAFSSLYSATPGFYIENRRNLLSVNPLDKSKVYIHNSGQYGNFYGVVQECYVKLVVNDKSDYNKILRFLEFNSQVFDTGGTLIRNNTITAFKIDTENQTTGKVTYSTDRFKHKFNKWRLKIPRDQNSTSKHGRLRNTYFIVTLYFDNTGNRSLILNKLLSHYDIQMF